MRRAHTLLTTSLSTDLRPKPFAAAANTCGMLAMRACHLSLSTAHLKHCTAQERRSSAFADSKQLQVDCLVGLQASLQLPAHLACQGKKQ